MSLTSARTRTHINNTDRDEGTLIPEIDGGITVLKSIAITIPLPAPSVSSELFQILSKPRLCCGRASPAGLVLWTVRRRLTRADRFTRAKIEVCTTGAHKQCNLGLFVPLIGDCQTKEEQRQLLTLKLFACSGCVTLLGHHWAWIKKAEEDLWVSATTPVHYHLLVLSVEMLKTFTLFVVMNAHRLFLIQSHYNKKWHRCVKMVNETPMWNALKIYLFRK